MSDPIQVNFGRYIRLADFKTKELTGITSGSADTQALFRHATKTVPAFWLPLEGDVYVPRSGLGPDQVDIRSHQTSQAFRVLLFFG